MLSVLPTIDLPIRAAGVLLLTLASLAAAPAPPVARYFRSDAGLSSGAAASYPSQLEDPATLAWRAPLDPGHSSPALCGERIFLTTFHEANRELGVVALAASSGRPLWRQAVPAPGIESFHQAYGSAAQATPACDGERVYVFFGSYGLVCYDLDGALLWEHRLGPFRDEYGSGSSPILVEDKVILQQDHDLDSFVMALDRRTGTVKWRVARPDAVRSYATPAVWKQDGRTELLVAGALELAAYDPATGERLWWIPGLARIVIPTPVPAGDLIYMASWAPGGDAGKRIALPAWAAALEKWDRNHNGRLARAEIDDGEVLDRFFRMDLDQSGELDQAEWEKHAEVFRRARNALLAIRPGNSRGQLKEDAIVWQYQRGVPYVPTPLLLRENVWMVKDGGIVTRLDAASGRVGFEERLPGLGGYYASPVGGDGKVYFSSERGVVSVVADAPEWRVLASRDLNEKIYATPLLDSGRLFLRTEKALYCWK